MGLTLTNLVRESAGSQFKVRGTLTFDNSYLTGGESLSAALLGLDRIEEVDFEDSMGYTFDGIIAAGGASALVKAYYTAGGSGTIATVSAGTPAGTNSATKLNLATPAFSGTGFATAGQEITTADNQTMAAVDTAAGMYFYCPADAAVAPVLILSNTIVAGAPAVLTVQGIAPATNAGAYKIVQNVPATFTGAALAVHGHTLTGTSTGALTEVTNATNLSAVVIDFEVYGR